MFLWLYDFRYGDYTIDSFRFTRAQLIQASQLKLKITNSKLFDIFIVTAKAFGNDVKGTEKANKALPKASFASMESFLSGG